MSFITKLFTGGNDREIKKLWPIVDEINDLEAEIQALDDDALRAKTDEFRAALRRTARRSTTSCPRPSPSSARRSAAASASAPSTCSSSAPSSCTRARSPSSRPVKARRWSPSLAMYLNALDGRGVHLITVNDYLAKRDAQWYGRVLAWMGISVGVLQHDSVLHRLARRRSAKRTAWST